MKGYSDVLIGLQYGDEGKGRVIDNIAEEYDITARFGGGPNAGHTLELSDRKIILHGIPSGIHHPNMQLYVGSGCVVNTEKLIKEKQEIENNGINLNGRLQISDQTTVILPHHILLDTFIGKEIGTTNNGIGPAYADRALRSDGKRLKNLRLGDLIDDPECAKKTILNNYYNTIAFYNMKAPDYILGEKKSIKQKAEEIVELAQSLKKYICRNPLWLEELVSDGKKVLFEGAQATMLDVAKGTVPYVTSSHTIAGNAYVGGDLPPKYHRKTIGVAKAIMSRVGNGPFVSEFGGKLSEYYCAQGKGKKHNEKYENKKYDIEKLLKSDNLLDIGIALRILGQEYGATTKRPRRIGMLDLVMLAHNCKVNGVDELYLNKVDKLVDFSKTKLKGIPVVREYEIDGIKINHIPGTTKMNREAKPVIEYLPFIKQDLSSVKKYEDLCPEAKEFITIVEILSGCKIKGIGVGAKREEFIKVE